jgi:CheY-like chemotaxis protein
MEAVGRLAGGIAHDFNNLLGVMIGYAEAGLRRLEQTNPVRPNFDEILTTAKRAASLTQQLLAFSRQQVMNPVVLDVNGIVAEVEKMLGRVIGADIDLSIRLATALGRVKADHSQIEQILMNLAVNARDAMPKGGKLSIQTANLEMDEAFVRQHPYPVKRGNYVCITVSDTGTGMDSQTRAKAFQPFFTTKEKGKGTGLGLSTVYGIVKQSGGYVDIHSAVGDGTTFKIYLPRTDEPLGTVGRPTSESAALAMATETILLAEDETALRILTRDALRERGYTVLEAKDGREALEIQREHVGVIDLLLTDIVMPELGGHALGQEIVRERPGIRILYMSGYTDSYTTLLLGNGKSFIRKPFTGDVLMEKIREAIEAEVVAEESTR